MPAKEAGHVTDPTLAGEASSTAAQSIDLPAAAASLSTSLELGAPVRIPKRFRSIGTGPVFTFAALPNIVMPI